MRLVRINAPQGKGADIARTAFSVGINQASVFQVESHRADGEPQTKDAVKYPDDYRRFAHHLCSARRNQF